MASISFLLKNSAASGSSHGSLQDGSSVTTATSGTGFRVGTTAATNYALQNYNSIVTTFTGAPEPSAAPNTSDSWRSESRLNGTFASGSWSIALSVIASVANATGSGLIRVRIWKSSNADGSSATELTTSVATTTQWNNVTTSTAQNLTATASIAETNFINEYLFVQTAIQIDTAGANPTAEIRYRVDGTNSKITTTQFNISFPGTELFNDIYNTTLSNESTANLLGGESNFETYTSTSETSLNLAGNEVQNDAYNSPKANEDGSPLNAYEIQNDAYSSTIENGPTLDGSYQTSIGSPTGISLTTYYAMRAIDPDCPTLTYVSWVVQDSPDITGSQYTGPRCGASTLQNITVSAKWRA